MAEGCNAMTNQLLFGGTGQWAVVDPPIPAPPAWRAFGRGTAATQTPADLAAADASSAPAEQDRIPLAPLASQDAAWMMNAALLLRRPLLVAGPPGAGKTTLATLVAAELNLGRVLRWPITSSTRLVDGLYHYDAIGWVQDQNSPDQRAAAGQGRSVASARRIGRFIRLGPVGTALLPWRRPRVLLIDEIDKADIDLPNDLLHVFEEGQFEIPELFRLDDEVRAEIPVYTSDRSQTSGSGRPQVPTRIVRDGVVRCFEFPVVVMTSNGERSFPPAFLRRCLRLDLGAPNEKQLRDIVAERILAPDGRVVDAAVRWFLDAIARNDTVAVDQLLNAVHLLSPAPGSDADRDLALRRLMDKLND